MEQKGEEGFNEVIVDTDNSKFSDTTISQEVIADLHIHSKYSRATSKDLDLKNLVKWARIKGVNLLGSGDFTHTKWLEELKTNLFEKESQKGVYWYKDSEGEFPFILSSELSFVYTKNDKGRRVHLVLFAPSFEVVDRINEFIDSKGFRRDYDGRPIFGIAIEEFVKEMKLIDDMIEIIPAHIWTPWFGVFGSKGGFDSLDEAFGDQVKHIHAIETGISSDPLMNVKIKELVDKDISIVSFSDLHSFWPWRLGREATIFNGNINLDFDYSNLINQIRENSFNSTIEVDPAYGKYHWDGHRPCEFVCSPAQTLDLDGKCPKCGKLLIIGVDFRVEELSKLGKKGQPVNTSIFSVTIPPKTKKFFRLLPLHELIAHYLETKNPNSKKVWGIYNFLINKFKTEFNILMRIDKNIIVNELKEHPKLAELIIDNRIANLKISPGYDGVYGKII